MEAEVVVQANLALLFFNVHRAVAFAGDFVAAACYAVAFLALGKAVVTGLTAGTLATDDVRLAFAVSAEFGALLYFS